eukprot:2515320-Pleurochrysis_carterae.AAC.3
MDRSVAACNMDHALRCRSRVLAAYKFDNSSPRTRYSRPRARYHFPINKSTRTYEISNTVSVRIGRRTSLCSSIICLIRFFFRSATAHRGRGKTLHCRGGAI